MEVLGVHVKGSDMLNQRIAKFVEARPQKETQEDWDFTKESTKYATHGLHVYPARMVPKLAERLITLFSSPGDTILDPFCGSGGVLVESRLHGRDSVGVDINPFACFLGRVKGTPLDPKKLSTCWDGIKPKIAKEIDELRQGKIIPLVPNFTKENSVEHWFKPYVIQELAVIRHHLLQIKGARARNFFLVSFSQTVRDVSNARRGEYKLYVMSPEQLKKHKPNVLETFISQVENSLKCMQEFFEKYDKSTECGILLSDARSLPLENETIDLIVTSPPYGDSQTTVGYGQFSKYSMLWLGIKGINGYKVDSISLGGRQSVRKSLDSKTLAWVLEEISKNEITFNHKRAPIVLNFFLDLDQGINEMSRVLKTGKYACIIIGNRSVRGFRIPTDKIIEELGRKHGLIHVKTIPRNIPTKRHPRSQRILIDQASSLQEPGAKTMWVDNILTEKIVIMRKM